MQYIVTPDRAIWRTNRTCIFTTANGEVYFFKAVRFVFSCLSFSSIRKLSMNAYLINFQDRSDMILGKEQQATGLDAWASRVKCPARFESHLHEICIYIYIYIWVVYSLCFFCCLFITVTWWYVWCIEWASGNQEEVQACLVTLWLFIKSCYSLYKTTLGLLCSWFENNPHFHKYSMDFHV